MNAARIGAGDHEPSVRTDIRSRVIVPFGSDAKVERYKRKTYTPMPISAVPKARNATAATDGDMWRLTPQFSGRALPHEARRERIMKWSARVVAATPYHGPPQLLVRRLERRLFIFDPSAIRPVAHL